MILCILYFVNSLSGYKNEVHEKGSSQNISSKYLLFIFDYFFFFFFFEVSKCFLTMLNVLIQNFILHML